MADGGVPRVRGFELETPIGAATRGVTAGMAATLLLAALSRVVAAVRIQLDGGAPPETPPGPNTTETYRGSGDPADRTAGEQSEDGSAAQPPRHPGADPTDPEHLRARQADRHARGEGPPPASMGAGHLGGPGGPTSSGGSARRDSRPVITPAGALVERQTAGTEDLAEELAYKVAAGVFDRDISAYLPLARFAVHMGWGATGGLLYGLLEGSYDWPVFRSGVLFGLWVWLLGPASLAPAMKLMRSVREEPPSHTAMMLAGHATYGAILAWGFHLLRPVRWR